MSHRRRLFLPNFRPAAPMSLTFGSLPPPHQLQALRILAVPLIPTPWLEDSSAPLAQAIPRLESPTSGRTRRWEGMLILSQGRLSLPLGPPERLLQAARAFFFRPPSDGQHQPPLYSGPPAVEAREPPKTEGDREGYQLENSQPLSRRAKKMPKKTAKKTRAALTTLLKLAPINVAVPAPSCSAARARRKMSSADSP